MRHLPNTWTGTQQERAQQAERQGTGTSQPNTSTGCFRLALFAKPRHWGQSECSSLIGWFLDMVYFQQWSRTESKTPHVTLLGRSYSETTWAVGIAQLTHHEVQGGAKIPRPEVEGFLPPPRTEWWVNCAIPTAHVVLLLSHTLFG